MTAPGADVVVVGGGPAGSITALTLASEGARVVLLEAARYPRDKVCGDALIPDSAIPENGSAVSH